MGRSDESRKENQFLGDAKRAKKVSGGFHETRSLDRLDHLHIGWESRRDRFSIKMGKDEGNHLEDGQSDEK